jgi:hypothetical protein
MTDDGAGASTLICSDFVVLESTLTGRGRPPAVDAVIGVGGVVEV